MKPSEFPYNFPPAKGDNLFNGIREVIAPWRPSDIRTYLDYDIDEDMNRLLVEMRFGLDPRWVFYYRFPFPRGFEPQEELERLFIISFQNNWRTHRLAHTIFIPSNVYLGEN